MHDADYFTEIIAKEIALRESIPHAQLAVDLRPLIFNCLKQAQADAVDHTADLCAEWLNASDVHLSDTVCGNLRQLAEALDPGIKARRVVSRPKVVAMEPGTSLGENPEEAIDPPLPAA